MRLLLLIRLVQVCKKYTHESCRKVRLRKGVKNWKPSVDTMPANEPISMAPNGWMPMSATAPTATPPANVAF